ncbi:hypothetical protein HXX76_003345 [Chlamydomonas incerta]|uniref:Uncharacterized protein n=1 Tax=Chlamydomonas incerta TaxID=51695 RepID=A0A835W6Y1_CHLIN|nr:hypothetical protein HXX76_003345 [Chlamydomonas incerta]|eukprot:KAG2441730.1 hypothetical protein HXX76_003345 [Chlamydomonas incerta]
MSDEAVEHTAPIAQNQFARLTADLLRRIAKYLHPNDVAANLKLVDSETAACLRGEGYSVLQLCQRRTHRRSTVTVAQDPWPSRDFVAHWGRPEPWQSLTLPQRRRLLCLAASSHHGPSLEVALEHCRVPAPACVEVLEAAAAAGDVAACERLLSTDQQGPRDYIVEFAVAAAAQEGQVAVLQRFAALGYAASCSSLGSSARAACYAGQPAALAWLVERYPPGMYDDGHAWELAIAAAEGGHPALAQQLLEGRAGHLAEAAATAPGAEKLNLRRLLCGLAFGCPLPAFEHFHGYVPAGWGRVLDSVAAAGSVLSCIVCSVTPDWERKLAWLQELCRSSSSDCGAAGAADAAAGVPLAGLFGGAAAGRAGVYMDWAVAATRADFAQRLRALHATGFGFLGLAAEEVAEASARRGDMEALSFVIDTLGGRVTGRVEQAAVSGGHLPLLQLTRKRGACFTPRDVVTAAGYQRWAAAQWLADAAAEDAEYGCDDEQYEGKVWADVFSHVARSGAPLSLLQHLHRELGAAVDRAAVAAGGSLAAEQWAASVTGAEPGTEVGSPAGACVGEGLVSAVCGQGGTACG